ncbi:RNA guanine-N7 methyltransferase activating subunit-like [Drosophila tropicalis]|uniref:RNA guanine-N7 methyltransferase activating subunit-like n=1 Tax=Drosophila tropicalis TaxID=46794 RepID=UPI0035ABC4D7
MVDPNRKINLQVIDSSLLEDYEEEFAYRFTDDDPEFMAHCRNPVPDPPLVENWAGGGGFSSGGGGHDTYYNRWQRRGGGYNRGWQRRAGGGGGGGGGYQNSYYNHNNERPYHIDRRNRDESRNEWNGGRERTGERTYDHRSRHSYGPDRSGGGSGGSGYRGGNTSRSGGSSSNDPMRVRRDYGNFVPASKD